MRPRASSHVAVLVALLALLVLHACASSQALKRTAVASEQLALSTQRIQQQEIILYDAGEVKATDHAKWQQGFLATGRAIQGLNAAIRIGNAAEVQAKVRTALDEVDRLLVQTDLLPQNARLVLLASLEGLRAILVSLSVVEV